MHVSCIQVLLKNFYESVVAVCAEFTLPTVHTYMYAIRSNAEQSVRSLLRRVAKEKGAILNSIDYLDEGSPVRPLHLFFILKFADSGS